MVPSGVVRGRANPRHWTFPERLRKARRAAGLSCAALSRLAGLGGYTVASIEAGIRVPRLRAVELLGDALRASPAYLAYGLDVPWEPTEGMRCAGVGERARRVREERGITLREVGRLIASSAGTVQAIERGTMPGIDTLELLAQALGVSPPWLAYGIGLMEATTRRSRPAPAFPP